MANNSIALGVEVPNFGNSFAQGQEAGQQRQMNSMKMEMAQKEQGREEAMQLMQMLGSAGMYALNGDMNGTPDPAKWDEAMDGLAQFGLDSAKYKGKPGLAPILVNSSVSAADRIKMAQDDRDFLQSLREFQLEIDKADAAANKPQSVAGKLAADRAAGIIDDDTYKAATTKATAPPKLSATELKAVHAAEDELPNLDASISQLERALALNDKAFSGYTAGMRGAIGAKLPDVMVPDAVADPASAAATSEYQAIMTGEAAAAMSAALKGATTDRELGIFMDIISDVSKPPEVRKNAITRLLELARAKKATAANRIGELKGAGTGGSAPTGEAGENGRVTIDGIEYEPDGSGGWYEVE